MLFYLPISGFGFTIDNVLDNNTPADYSDDLKDAARWTNTPASLVKNGVRGLGGGIEYSISSDFFAKLIPSFIDSVPPTEEQLKEAIKRAFNTWAEGSPIYFTDVSDQIKPVRSRSWTGTVAELGADDDPFNKMAINCEDSLKGLKLSPNIDPNAVATSKGSGTTVRLKLTNDYCPVVVRVEEMLAGPLSVGQEIWIATCPMIVGGCVGFVDRSMEVGAWGEVFGSYERGGVLV